MNRLRKMYWLIDNALGDLYRAVIGLEGERSKKRADPRNTSRSTTAHDVARMLLACRAHRSLVFGAFCHALPDVLLSQSPEIQDRWPFRRLREPFLP